MPVSAARLGDGPAMLQRKLDTSKNRLILA